MKGRCQAFGLGAPARGRAEIGGVSTLAPGPLPAGPPAGRPARFAPTRPGRGRRRYKSRSRGADIAARSNRFRSGNKQLITIGDRGRELVQAAGRGRAGRSRPSDRPETRIADRSRISKIPGGIGRAAISKAARFPRARSFKGSSWMARSNDSRTISAGYPSADCEIANHSASSLLTASEPSMVLALRGRRHLESAPPFRDISAKPGVAFCEEPGAPRWITEGSFWSRPGRHVRATPSLGSWDTGSQTLPIPLGVAETERRAIHLSSYNDIK